MATRKLVQKIENFRGLSTRKQPIALTPEECSDCLNVEWSERDFRRRQGWVKTHANPLRDASLRLDGRNDYARFTMISEYDPTQATERLYVGIGIKLRSLPTVESTVVGSGFGTAGNLFFRLTYDPALPGWRMRVRDTTAGATVTYSITDGDASGNPVGIYRYLEWLELSGTTRLHLWDEAGNESLSATTTNIATYNWSAANDMFLGVSNVGPTANVIGTDFLNASLCEFRYRSDNGSVVDPFWATAANRYYITEVPDSEAQAFTGYWKLNDGTAAYTLANTRTTFPNVGKVPQNPARWITDTTKIVAGSGLEFFGESSFVYLKDIPNNQFQGTFNATTPNVSRWTLRGVYTPALLQGAATVADCCLCWAGSVSALPSPVGIRVVGDRFQAIYNDNGGAVTLTLNAGGDPTVTSLVGKRVRIALWRVGAGTGVIAFGIAWQASAGSAYTTKIAQSAALTAFAPSVVSQEWSFGRHVLNYADALLYRNLATAFDVDGAVVGALDDWQLIWTNTANSAQAVGLGQLSPLSANNPFMEVTQWGGTPTGVNQTIFCLKMNESSGNVLNSEVNPALWRSRLLPEDDDGAQWDVGLVDPYRPVPIQLVHDYDRFTQDGSQQRQVVVLHGCTLSTIDPTLPGTQTATPISAGIFKGGRATYSQYGQKMFLASRNGRRPMWGTGGQLRYLGIRAPLAPLIITTKVDVGTFSGTYFFYVTYRNKDNADESNPSPGLSVTFAGGAGTDTIDSIELPISADPQVNQRRVWMTGVAGADGATAYLLLTIDDNVTPLWTQDVTTPVGSGLALEYTGNEEAPQASLTENFGDAIFASGNSVYPTRVYRSVVLSPASWDYSSPTGRLLFIDVDQDKGRPVTAIAALPQMLVAELGDGKTAILLTGDSDQPFVKSTISVVHGAVGPQAVMVADRQVYIGERDFYAFNGSSEENLTSPEEFGAEAPKYLRDGSRTSISDTVRRKLTGSDRATFGIIDHRSRNQWWFLVTVQGVRSVLVFDTSQRVWSPYDLAIDSGRAIDDAVGDPVPWGGINGFVGKFDQSGACDGLASAGLGAVVSSVVGLKINVTGTPFMTYNPRLLRGMPVWVYRYATNTILKSVVYDNDASSVTIYATPTSVAASDVLVVGGIGMFAEWCLRFGDSAAKKVLENVELRGLSDNASNYVRMSYKKNVDGRDPAYTGWTEVFKNWLTTDAEVLLHMGDICNSVRFRIGESGLSTGASSPDPVPMVSGSIQMSMLAITASEADVR